MAGRFLIWVRVSVGILELDFVDHGAPKDNIALVVFFDCALDFAGIAAPSVS
jgi:hypothetical protein